MIDPINYLNALLFLCAIGAPVLVVVLLLLAHRKRRAQLKAVSDPVAVRGVWSRPDVEKYAKHAMGPLATFREVPVPENIRRVYGVVTCPGHHRIVSVYDRYSPGEGRRRIVQRLSDPEFVKSAKK